MPFIKILENTNCIPQRTSTVVHLGTSGGQAAPLKAALLHRVQNEENDLELDLLKTCTKSVCWKCAFFPWQVLCSLMKQQFGAVQEELNVSKALLSRAGIDSPPGRGQPTKPALLSRQCCSSRALQQIIQCWITPRISPFIVWRLLLVVEGYFCLSSALSYTMNYHNLQFIIEMVLIVRFNSFQCITELKLLLKAFYVGSCN